MRIKKFTGATFKLATDRMRKELGEDAIILDTRKIAEDDGLSIFAKERFEITAAIDDQAAQKSDRFSQHLAMASARSEEPANSTLASLQKIALQFDQRSKEKPPVKKPDLPTDDSTRQDNLKEEVERLRKMIEEISAQMQNAASAALPVDTSVRIPFSGRRTNENHEATPIENAEASNHALAIIGSKAEQRMANELALISTEPESLPGATKVVALVGPEGLEKTTTLAKLAAVQKIRYNKDVAMISAATHRITAIEQLKTFSAMTDIPVEIVYRQSEIKAALSTFRGKDMVLIDTIGKGPGMHLVRLPAMGTN